MLSTYLKSVFNFKVVVEIKHTLDESCFTLDAVVEGGYEICEECFELTTWFEGRTQNYTIALITGLN